MPPNEPFAFHRGSCSSTTASTASTNSWMSRSPIGVDKGEEEVVRDLFVRGGFASVISNGNVREVNGEQRAHAIHLSRHAMRGEHLGQLVLHPSALPVELLVHSRRQFFQGGHAGCHSERVAVVSSPLGEVWLASRVQQLHYFGATAKRSHRQASADDLSHRRQVRSHAVKLLSSARRDAQ